MATRTQKQAGATYLKHVDRIMIVSNPDIRENLGCIGDCCARIFCCGYAFSSERSYIYVRENSIETNFGLEGCCFTETCCTPIDNSNVQYFDQPPFVLYPCCGCNKGEPQFSVLEPGCMCCCVKCSAENGCGCCFGEKLATITPFDTYCCCCSNYATNSSNCYGCFGPITGNPYNYKTLFPQPNTGDDVEIFVATAAKALDTYHGRASKA
jgi:hypothetical protein